MLNKYSINHFVIPRFWHLQCPVLGRSLVQSVDDTALSLPLSARIISLHTDVLLRLYYRNFRHFCFVQIASIATPLPLPVGQTRNSIQSHRFTFETPALLSSFYLWLQERLDYGNCYPEVFSLPFQTAFFPSAPPAHGERLLTFATAFSDDDKKKQKKF